MRCIGLIGAIVCGVFATPALGATVRVPQDHATIQAAVDAAGDGDVIVIRAGTYAEQVTIAGVNGLTLRGRGKVVIEPGGPFTPISVGAVSGLTVQGLTLIGSNAALTSVSSTDLTLLKCTLDGANGASFLSSTGVAVLRCRVQSTTGIALRTTTGTDVAISRCKIKVTTDAGQAIVTTSVENLQIDRCKIEHTTPSTEVSLSLQYTVSGTVTRCRISSQEGGPFERAAIRGDFNNTQVVTDVSNNRIEGFEHAISVSGQGSRIVGNRVFVTVVFAGSFGIAGNSLSDTLVSRNRVTIDGNFGAAILVVGTDCTVSRNRTSRGEFGVSLAGGMRSVALRNSARDTRFGVHLSGDDQTAERNTVKNAEVGIYIANGSDHTIGPRNKFKNCDDDIDDDGTNTVYL